LRQWQKVQSLPWQRLKILIKVLDNPIFILKTAFWFSQNPIMKSGVSAAAMDVATVHTPPNIAREPGISTKANQSKNNHHFHMQIL
jgi:hypothetical protein